MTLGICGFTSTGSSAVIDLLHEFDEFQVLDKIEFGISYCPDGLEDLDYHVNKYSKYTSSVVAIERFRRLMLLLTRIIHELTACHVTNLCWGAPLCKNCDEYTLELCIYA